MALFMIYFHASHAAIRPFVRDDTIRTRFTISISFVLEVSMQRNTFLIGGGILVVLIAVTAFLYFNSSPSLKGGVITPPWPAPEINLTDHNGQPFIMTSQRGKVVLMYFGYVNCPDECPLTMAHLKLALDSLGVRAKDVQVVMVSTDPARDTPQALKDFMGHFDPSFLGLTGTPEELQKAWSDYGVHVENGGETHSTFIYVVDPAGNIRETFLPDSEPGDIAGDVELLLKGK
jgi:protein SCO1/2